jgi:hypothetical protein
MLSRYRLYPAHKKRGDTGSIRAEEKDARIKHIKPIMGSKNRVKALSPETIKNAL